ncbi:hypothetical protein DVS28_b0530 (plasmid) [Euzebya pacifica]|uniref:Uncharacterized protein n=1 Tax=Euzebya pacifica TaxID=1608957 RepID=A0A346Y723_9ACTN|nr:hypothetical protein DVS28_b0530 [Euzebya pacifica]
MSLGERSHLMVSRHTEAAPGSGSGSLPGGGIGATAADHHQ